MFEVLTLLLLSCGVILICLLLYCLVMFLLFLRYFFLLVSIHPSLHVVNIFISCIGSINVHIPVDSSGCLHMLHRPAVQPRPPSLWPCCRRCFHTCSAFLLYFAPLDLWCIYVILLRPSKRSCLTPFPGSNFGLCAGMMVNNVGVGEAVSIKASGCNVA